MSHEKSVTEFTRDLVGVYINAGVVKSYAKDTKGNTRLYELSNKEIMDIGIEIHSICETDEKEYIDIDYCTEADLKIIRLANTISLLNQLHVAGRVCELPIKTLVHGTSLRGIIDRIIWNKDKKEIEVIDIKSHYIPFILDDPELKGMPQSKRLGYSFQLHVYVEMLDWLFTASPDALRDSFIGSIYNKDEPIHPIICSKLEIPKTITANNLFDILLKERSVFTDVKYTVSIMHIDQNYFKSEYKTGKASVVYESIKCNREWFKKMVFFDLAELERKKSLAEIHKKAAMAKKREEKKKIKQELTKSAKGKK